MSTPNQSNQQLTSGQLSSVTQTSSIPTNPPQPGSAPQTEQHSAGPSGQPEGVPPELAAQINPVARAMAQQLFQLQVSPAEDPVLKHVNTEILANAIAAQTKKDEQEFQLKRQNRDC
jgi:hypothetical protein